MGSPIVRGERAQVNSYSAENKIEQVGKSYVKRRKSRAIFRCHCGKEFDCLVASIKNGRQKSCGCLKTKNKGGVPYATSNPLYSLWNQILFRCENPKCRQFADYGGRGIRMCDEWRQSFASFSEYLNSNLGPRPKGHQIDRINNDGNYEPGNVRWATQVQQARNRRNSLKMRSGVSICDIVGAKRTRLVGERMRHGRTLEEALQDSVERRKPLSRAKPTVGDIAAQILRKTSNTSVMFGDGGLLDEIYVAAKMKGKEDHDPQVRWRHVLNCLERSPLFVKVLSSRMGKQRRCFRLKEVSSDT